MKCEICKKPIKQTILEKIEGAYVKDANGKLHMICDDCQKKFPTKKEVLMKLES